MNVEEIKKRLLSGEMLDQEFLDLLNKPAQKKKSGGFFKTLLTGFLKGYTEPQMLRIMLEALLLFIIIIGTIFLSYHNKIDMVVTSVLMAFILGFLFGKLNKI